MKIIVPILFLVLSINAQEKKYAVAIEDEPFDSNTESAVPPTSRKFARDYYLERRYPWTCENEYKEMG